MSEPPPRKKTPQPMRRPTPLALRRITPAPGRRADARVPAALPVVLRVGRRRLSSITRDVSHGGLSVSVDDEVPLRELARVELLLPSDGRPFSAMGMVAHHHPEAPGEGPAIGVAFYGLGREEQLRWDTFLLRARGGFAAPPPLVDLERLPRGRAVARKYRRDAGQVGVLEVTFRSADDLRASLLRDVPRGSMFVVTAAPTPFGPGDKLGVELVHPSTSDVFELDGRVRRRVEDDRVRGLEVKLAVEGDRRERLAEFVLDPLDPPEV